MVHHLLDQVEPGVLVVVVVDVVLVLRLLVLEQQIKVFQVVLQQAHQKVKLEVVVELVKLVEQTEREQAEMV